MTLGGLIKYNFLLQDIHGELKGTIPGISFGYVLPKYRYHLNGLNKASRAATRATHMCLGGKCMLDKSPCPLFA